MVDRIMSRDCKKVLRLIFYLPFIFCCDFLKKILCGPFLKSLLNLLQYCFCFVVVVQSLNHVPLFATSWTAAGQASPSFTISWSLLKLMSIESVKPSNHLVLCHPLLPLPSVFPSIRVFSSELSLRIRWPKYWSFSLRISPFNQYSGLISFTIE